MEGGKQAAAVEELWGKEFAWELKGAGVDSVWAITSDFLGVHNWMTSLVQSCELVEGQPQEPGSVRRVLQFPLAPGEPAYWVLQKLLEMDELHHRFSYTIIDGNLPGLSLVNGSYVSTFKLDPLASSQEGTVLQWSFVYRPFSPTFSKEQIYHMLLSLYQVAINDLKARLSLPDDSISFFTQSAS